MNGNNTNEVRKRTSHMGTLVIRVVPKAVARDLIVRGHYSHKWLASFGLYNFGIFREGSETDEDCLGVASFGYMKMPKARVVISTVKDGWMIEINRMWISDQLGRNAETILLGASLKLLRKLDPTIVAVQSFADGRVGCGTIYKAANFRYFGYHWTTFLQNRRSNEITHEQILTCSTCASGFIRTNAALLAGDMNIFRAKTHRYIYFLHPSARFIGNGKEQPYPPYEKGVEPAMWYINPERLRPRLIAAMDTLLDRWPHKRGLASGGE